MEDAILEALLEIEQKCADRPFTVDFLEEAPGTGFEMQDILNILCASGYLTKTGPLYKITDFGIKVLDEKPMEWIMAHLPLSSHSRQK